MNAITRKAITTGQVGQTGNMLADAARKAAEEIIPELEKSGVLDGDTIQRLQGNPALSERMKTMVKELLAELAENVTDRLKLISGAETLTLEPTDGKATIAKAGNVFSGYLDSDFKNWGCDVASASTGPLAIQAHEQVKDGTFEQIYGGMGDNLDAMCLSQGQIVQFFARKMYDKYLIRQNPDDAGYGYFRFLFKVGKEFFVADVSVNSDGGLEAYVGRLSCDVVWNAGIRDRFVIPQQAP